MVTAATLHVFCNIRSLKGMDVVGDRLQGSLSKV